MRFVVLRYGGTPPAPAAGQPLLDELTTRERDTARPHRSPADRSADAAPSPEDATVAAALADVLSPATTLRDDLAALAAALGVTTVLDETLASSDVATTVRSRAEGLSLTDGTASAPDGPLVGLHVLDAPDLDALVDVLTLLPAGTFEVHPVVAA